MKRTILLLLFLASYVIASANQRGVTFEKDGLVYTISSECVFCDYKNGKYIVKNEGEAFVSGVTVSDCEVVIPTVVTFPSTYGRIDTTEATYHVLGIGEKAFEGAKLKGLFIPLGFKFIGDEAFHNMELSSGVLVVPPVVRIKANVFDGMKAKLVFRDLKEASMAPVKFESTFKNSEHLPDIYVSHAAYGTRVTGVDKSIFYTIGETVFNEWISGWTQINLEKTKNGLNRSSSLMLSDGKRRYAWNDVWIKPGKIDKTGSDIDLLPDYVYECRTNYMSKSEIFQELSINETLFRGKKGEEYFYYSIDGKPITDKESLIDDKGQDPFGLQVISQEELKKKREVKEREKSLNQKMNQLKNILGF